MRSAPVQTPDEQARRSEDVPLVHIVVLNWNRPELTLACLAALQELAYERYVVVTVDNGSTDGSEALIRATFPELTLLQAGENLGYAGGNNLGIQTALKGSPDWIWVLNNDTRPDRHSLAELVAAAGTAGAAAAISRQLPPTGDRDETIAFTVRGRVYERVGCDGCAAGFHAADMVTGPSLLLRADVLREIGLFDERYFHYYEEVDLVERIRRRGWPVGVACRSIVRHLGGGTLARNPQSHYYEVRNLLLYRRKLHGAGILRTALSVGRALRLRDALRFRNVRFVTAGGFAMVDALRGKGGRRDLGPAYEAVATPHAPEPPG